MPTKSEPDRRRMHIFAKLTQYDTLSNWRKYFQSKISPRKDFCFKC